jgi:hypothetical protein
MKNLIGGTFQNVNDFFEVFMGYYKKKSKGHHVLIPSTEVVTFVLLVHLMFNLHHVIFKQHKCLRLVYYQVPYLLNFKLELGKCSRCMIVKKL